MPQPIRRGSVYWFRKGVPEDLRPILKKTEEKFSLGTRDAAEARVKFAKALAEIEERWARLRAGTISLSHKQSWAIAGKIYAEMISERENDPQYNGRIGDYLADAEAFGEAKFVPLSKNKELTDRVIASYRKRRADDIAKRIDDFLIREGFRLNAESRNALEKHVAEAIFKARAKINKMADKGDYGPDPEASKFPSYEPMMSKPEALTRDDGPLLSDAVSAWINEKTREDGEWVDSSAEDNELAARRFIELVGDKSVTQYKKKDARAFKEALMCIPAHFVKLRSFEGLSFLEAVDKAKRITAGKEIAKEPFERLADKTVNKNLGFLRAFWNWAIAQYDDVQGNPFNGLNLKIKTNPRDERYPFSTIQLQQILDAPLFVGCKSEKAWLTPGRHVPFQHSNYWVPLIGLFTGARAGEIIQLHVNDVAEEEGIAYFKISDDGEDQDVKTDASLRQIPVHSMLKKLGFMDFVAIRRKTGARLFPDFPKAVDGYYSTAFSPRFARFLKSVGAKTDKHTFHSFRHSFEDEAISSRIPVDLTNALQGHSTQGMAARYGSGLVFLQVLQEEIEKIQYKRLDFSRLLKARQTANP